MTEKLYYQDAYETAFRAYFCIKINRNRFFSHVETYIVTVVSAADNTGKDMLAGMVLHEVEPAFRFFDFRRGNFSCLSLHFMIYCYEKKKTEDGAARRNGSA